MSESTEPRAAAREIIADWYNSGSTLTADDLIDSLESAGVLATIAPDDPGRVVIDLDTLRCWRDDAESAANESASAIGLLMDIQQAITAAERAATGENYE